MELAWSKPRFYFGRFHELAVMAGAIISAEGASAQGVYLDFGNNPGPAIATTTDLGTGIGKDTGSP
jgi:hypothetical protein